MSPHDRRFADAASADRYARYRPDYPVAMVERLAAQVAAVPDAALPVFDAGCGTGIFTCRLADALPPGRTVVGIEPAAGMRALAQKDASSSLRFVAGRAEALPAADATVAAVTAATAAHWFDRPRFYAEAARVVVPGGVLAIVEYVRDTAGSPAAAAVERFLREEGGPSAYRRPDYPAEIAAAPEWEPIDHDERTVTMALDGDGFAGLALSSSHARPIVERLGAGKARARLARIGAALAGPDGRIDFGYRFAMIVARRR